MTTDPFELALAFVLRSEGGFVDHPDDPGGATNLGVSLRAIRLRDFDRDGTLDFDLDRDGDVDVDDVRLIKKDDARKVYRQDYWMPAQCGLLPTRHAVALFDAAVHLGPRTAVGMLQKAVGVNADGIVGVATGAACKRNPEALASFGAARARKYQQIVANKPTSGQFLDGWMKRLFMLAEYCGGIPA